MVIGRYRMYALSFVILNCLNQLAADILPRAARHDMIKLFLKLRAYDFIGLIGNFYQSSYMSDSLGLSCIRAQI